VLTPIDNRRRRQNTWRTPGQRFTAPTDAWGSAKHSHCATSPPPWLTAHRMTTTARATAADAGMVQTKAWPGRHDRAQLDVSILTASQCR